MKFLGKLLGEVERPFVAVLGGAKVSDKIEVLENLLGRVDAFLIGGAMANTFLKAQGRPASASRCVEEDKLALARAFLRKAEDAKRRRAAAARRGRGRRASTPTSGRVVRGDAVPDGPDGARHRARDGARLRRRDRARARRSSGTGRWACSRRRRSRPARWRSPRRWPRARGADGGRRRRLGGGGQREPASPTRSPTSRPAAAPRSSSSRARRCRASRRWR